MDRRTFLAASLAAPLAANARAEAPVSRLLYVVCPGIRDYLEFGGAGILVFDIDKDHKFVKRISPASRGPRLLCSNTKRAKKFESPPPPEEKNPASRRNIRGAAPTPATKK